MEHNSYNGTPRQVLDRLAASAATLLFSDETFTELAVRLAKPKFDRYRTIEQMNSFLDWLSQLGEWVVPVHDVAECRDPDDNKFLAVALSGDAGCLITGNSDLLELEGSCTRAQHPAMTPFPHGSRTRPWVDRPKEIT